MAAAQLNGKTWVKLSTTVRCGGEEALAFLLNKDSRSMMSENDLVEKEVVREKNRLTERDKGENNSGHTQVVSVYERKMLISGTKVKNQIIRRCVWKEDSKKIGNFLVLSSPTQCAMSKVVNKRHNKDFLEVIDQSIVSTRIIQISASESSIEFLYDLERKSATNNTKKGGPHQASGSWETDSTIKHKKIFEYVRQGHDCEYRTLVKMQKSFQVSETEQNRTEFSTIHT